MVKTQAYLRRLVLWSRQSDSSFCREGREKKRFSSMATATQVVCGLIRGRSEGAMRCLVSFLFLHSFSFLPSTRAACFEQFDVTAEVSGLQRATALQDLNHSYINLANGKK